MNVSEKNGSGKSASKTWRRFLANRRGSVSLMFFCLLYLFGICSELICSDKPLILFFNGKVLFPALIAYSQDEVLGNGSDLKMVSYDTESLPAGFRAVYAPFRAGPDTIFTTKDLAAYRRLSVSLEPEFYAAGIYFDKIGRSVRLIGDTAALSNEIHSIDFSMISKNAEARFANCDDGAFSVEKDGVRYLLPPFRARKSPPEQIRLDIIRHSKMKPWHTETEAGAVNDSVLHLIPPGLDASSSAAVAIAVRACLSGRYIPRMRVCGAEGGEACVSVELERLSWPFRPVPGHPMGFDAAGRDVLARLLYGMRTSMTFGLLLVCTTMLLGIAAGAVQGYFAGWVDITGQRLTEIWCALPFLYIMILLGNVFGRSFGLLLAVYAIFNWAGAAAYVRAEFLRLRNREFVDAARCQGLSEFRIMFRHILPNALTPLITLFPFSLVGAISALTMLDYLGFGMPDTAPSWGALLRQAQAFRRAWWLILYPAATLFTVMILGVFIGEGVRDAMDPRPYSKME